ncbi:hypothetical protein AB1N83_009792 [Pleurotus pulmonarius]
MISKYPDPQRWRTGRGDPYDQPCPWYICPAFGEQGALRSVTHSSSLQSTHRRQYILQATPLQRGITSQHDLAGAKLPMQTVRGNTPMLMFLTISDIDIMAEG